MTNGINTRKRRAMTAENARRVRQAGHDAEKEFADLIGGRVYSSIRKKDVIDAQGNIHSVKSGYKKLQMFLYGRSRFETSIGFFGSPLFIKCIDSFPSQWEKYRGNKIGYKMRLQQTMQNLKDFLSMGVNPLFVHNNKTIFLWEGMFHGNEVDYFTIKDYSIFHIFDAEEVVRVIDNSTNLISSKARNITEMDDLKVVFKLSESNITLGEIELRTDSEVHYGKVLFSMHKTRLLNLLKQKILVNRPKSDRIIAYGRAALRFKLNK